MHRPFTRAQALQNRAFLAALRATGNAREAARSLGVHRATYTKRRARDPAFAAAWDAALAAAAAGLRDGCARKPAGTTLTVTSSGRVQLRRAVRGRLTPAAQQAFLAALSATANVRLSAAAAGFTHAAFYAAAKRDPAFAREWGLALKEGCQTLTAALLSSFEPASHDHDDWRHNEPPAMPPMTATQALLLLSLHRRSVIERYPPQLRRRAHESPLAYEGRMIAIREAWYQRQREAFAVAEAARAEGTWTGPSPKPLYTLPDLAQVTGWSAADPTKPAHDEGGALFGGWRLSHWHAREERRRRGEED